jgi:hypothetical protein
LPASFEGRSDLPQGQQANIIKKYSLH